MAAAAPVLPPAVADAVHESTLDAITAQARAVAHSIGNPLTGLGLSLELLAQTPLTELQRRYLDRCLRVSERLNAYKELLGEFGGSARARPGFLQTAALIEQVLQPVRLLPEQHMHLDIPAQAAQLWGIEPVLIEAVRALVRNATDALPQGGSLGIKAHMQSDCLRLEVWDTGPGLSAAQAAQLWQKPWSTKAHGAGMGLLLVALVVERLHGGRVGFAPNAPCGARFFIDLPRPKDDGVWV